MTQDPQNHPLKPSSKTISESTREPQKARPTKPTAAEQPFKYEWPPEVQELGAAFEHLWRPARRPIDRADYAFWLNGKPARNVRGLKAFASQGITTAEMQAAFKNMQKDHLTVNSPASLWSVALDLHLRSNQTHDIPAAWQSSEAAPEPEHQEPQRLSDDDHAHSAWLQVKSAFEAGETSQANYKKWIAPSQAMSLDHGTLTIAASSQDARDWLDSRLTRTAERMLIGILNEAVEVKFIVQERNP